RPLITCEIPPSTLHELPSFSRYESLGLAIPYECLGVGHDYEPDFLVRLANGVTLLLEIKGYEVHDPEKTAAKHNAARRWVLAVNTLGDFGWWGFVVCRDLAELPNCWPSCPPTRRGCLPCGGQASIGLSSRTCGSGLWRRSSSA